MDANTECDLASINKKESEWKLAFEEAVKVRDRQLETLKKQLTTVENELQSIKLLLSKKDEELDDCKLKIQGLISEVKKCEEIREHSEKTCQSQLEKLNEDWENKLTSEQNVWQSKWEDQRAKYISSTFQLTKQLKKELDDVENQLENAKSEEETVKKEYEKLQSETEIKNQLIQQQESTIVKTTDEFNKVRNNYDKLIYENLKLNEHIKALQNNLIELNNENKSLKLINNNELIKKVNQMENLIKANLTVKGRELNLFEEIKCIKQEIKDIKKDAKEIAAQEYFENKMVCNKMKEEKTQCVQTDEFLSNNMNNIDNILSFKDEIFSLKEKEFVYKEKLNFYESQLEEITKQNTVFREIIKEFKKEREKMKQEELATEAEEKHVKQLEESIQRLKENMMQNTGNVGTDISKTVEDLRKEISELKNTQVRKGTINKATTDVHRKNISGYNGFEDLVSTKPIEVLQPKVTKTVQKNYHLR